MNTFIFRSKNYLLFLLCFAVSFISSAQVNDTIPKSYTPHQLDSLSSYYIGIGYYQEAIKYLNLIENPSLTQQREIAKIKYINKDYQGALDLLSKIMNQKDSTYKTLRLSALIYESVNNLDSAIYYRTKIQKKYPFNVQNLTGLYDLYKKRQEVFLILTPLNDYLYEYENNSLRQMRGLIYFDLKDYLSAYNDFKYLYEHGDHSLVTLYNYGELLVRRDSLTLASNVFSEALDSCDYEIPYILIDQAHVLTKLRKDSLVPSLLSRADSIITRTPSILFNRTKIEMIRGDLARNKFDTSSAIKHYLEAIMIDSESKMAADIAYKLALLYKDQGQYEPEKRYLNKFYNYYIDNKDTLSKLLNKKLEYVEYRLKKIQEMEFMSK